jgi:hypothetical protein
VTGFSMRCWTLVSKKIILMDYTWRLVSKKRICMAYLEAGLKVEDFHGLPKGCSQVMGFSMAYLEVGLKEEDL